MNVSVAQLAGRPDPWASSSKPFLVGVDDSGGRSRVTVHATREAMTRGDARQLRRQLREEGVFSQFRVKRYPQSLMRNAPSIESFLSPFNHDHIVYDASGVFLRAQRLVNFAYAVRAKFDRRVTSLLWQQDPSTLYIVLDPQRFPEDYKARRSEVARVAVQIRKALVANCGSRVGERIKGVKITFTKPTFATTAVDDRSLSPHLN